MKWLIDYRCEFDHQLEVWIGKVLPEGKLRDAAMHALSGGKRLRPALVTAIAPYSAAEIAVECFHTASLIADDLPCMDDALERRGKPALHRAFGESTALLTSYSLIALGYQLLGSGPPGAIEMTGRALGAFGLTGGQEIDLVGCSSDQLIEMVDGKTGALFGLATTLGWLYSKGQEKVNEAELLGRSLGKLFQFIDDCSDAEEDQNPSLLDLPAQSLDALMRSERKTIEGLLCALSLGHSRLAELAYHLIETAEESYRCASANVE